MITLTLTPLQHDIIKAAVANYAANLLEAVQPSLLKNDLFVDPPKPEVTIHKVRKTRKARRAKKTRVVNMAGIVDMAAPWGYKKDGTPRARPGRKAA